MKIIFRTALLTLFVVVFSACESQRQPAYQPGYDAQYNAPSYQSYQGAPDLSQTNLGVRSHNKDCCGNDEMTFTADLRTIQRSTGVTPVAPVQVVKQKPVTPIDSRPVAFKRGKLIAVDPRDADKLKLYNAVVVTLSVPANVEKLKRKFEKDGEFFFIAKNEKGWFYFIVWSSDDKDEAIAKRHEFVDKYTNRYSAKELQIKYGMPFTDAWIQINE